jgi:PAS domain S-box-containing protein
VGSAAGTVARPRQPEHLTAAPSGVKATARLRSEPLSRYATLNLPGRARPWHTLSAPTPRHEYFPSPGGGGIISTLGAWGTKQPDARERQVQALSEEREWLRVTLASIGDAVITTDARCCVTFLNPVAQSLTGWTQEEAGGVPLERVFRIINEETRQSGESPATRVLREGVVVGLANHNLLIAKDGTERPIDDSAAPIRNAKGEVVGVVLVFRDITERRRHERLVQDALAYAENIIATLREPFLVLDRDLRVRTANASFYRTFHTTKAETEGRFVYELGSGQWNIPRLRESLEDILANHHTIEDFEVEQTFPSVGHRIMLLNGQRFDSGGEHSTLILLAIEDVTERRRAEVAVKVSEIRYRRLFQTARDGILILDANTGTVIDANPFMTQLLGYSREELLDKELWQVGCFRDIEASRAASRELQERGYIRYEHLPLESKDGKPVEVEFISNVYAVDHRRVAQCNIRDISDRVRLERQAQEQTAALADLHRRKDEFLAMLSHELRNPLAPILNAVQILRLQGDGNPLQQQARSIIERQVGQLARLVDDLLEVSRITTGRVRLNRDRLDVRGVVERAVETARPVIDRHEHELSVSLPEAPIWLHADPTRLEQVLVNLLSNAAKYTDDRGRIWLTAQREGDHAVLRVRDTGIGIAPDLLSHIFDVFTQADRALDRSEGGLGIGLSVVRRLVEMHGGTVEAQSAGPGRGSEFTVRLPVAEFLAAEPAAPTGPPAKEPVQASRVLVVDDNVDTTDSMSILLRASGYDVRTAYDGLTALETATTWPPNVVLLDIGLPQMNGYEVAQRLRQDPNLKSAWLVALTGYGRESDLQLAKEAGFDAHLIKPVDLDKLQTLLTSWRR